MKKSMLICLALLLFLLFSSAALADTIPLSSMTDDEILSLYAQVNQEIVNRRLAKTAAVPKGSYIAGKDIPVGTYLYTCLAKESDWGNVTIYSDGGDGDQLLWEVVSAPEEGEEPESFMIELNEGYRLKSGVPFSLTVYTGIVFE